MRYRRQINGPSGGDVPTRPNTRVSEEGRRRLRVQPRLGWSSAKSLVDCSRESSSTRARLQAHARGRTGELLLPELPKELCQEQHVLTSPMRVIIDGGVLKARHGESCCGVVNKRILTTVEPRSRKTAPLCAQGPRSVRAHLGLWNSMHRPADPVLSQYGDGGQEARAKASRRIEGSEHA